MSGAMPRVGQFRGRIAQFVEEWVHHGINGSLSLGRGVLQQLSNKINRIGIGLAEHLIEGMWLDLWEPMFHVVRVHGPNLLTGGSTQNLDDLHKLVDSRLSREERLPQHELGHDASSRPHI